MRQTLFFVCIILFNSCTFVLSQVPPQKIYAGAGCTAPLPDYRIRIAATDNCEVSSLIQTPAPGFLLTATNKIANVVVRATDASGNSAQVAFSVTLLDTIKPKFTIDPSLLAYQAEQVKEIYNFGDKLIAEASANFLKQSWIDSIPGLREKLSDSAYYKKTMLTWTAKAHAVTGQGFRVFTFYDADKDTIIIRR